MRINGGSAAKRQRSHLHSLEPSVLRGNFIPLCAAMRVIATSPDSSAPSMKPNHGGEVCSPATAMRPGDQFRVGPSASSSPRRWRGWK